MQSKKDYQIGDLWKVNDHITKERFLFLVLEVDKNIGIRVTRLDMDRTFTIHNGSRYYERAIKVS
jgi:hypothetical protein